MSYFTRVCLISVLQNRTLNMPNPSLSLPYDITKIASSLRVDCVHACFGVFFSRFCQFVPFLLMSNKFSQKAGFSPRICMEIFLISLSNYKLRIPLLFFSELLLLRLKRFDFTFRLLRLSELILIGMFAYRLHTSGGQIDDMACYSTLH